MFSLTRLLLLVQDSMIDWISKKHRDKKLRETQEQQLRKSLAEKVSQYEEPSNNPIDDFTEVFLDGEKLRVAKQQITITDVLTGSLIKSPYRSGEP